MQPTAKRREVPDNVASGLYFIVQPSGAKSWAVRYRFARRPCKLTLGRYPAVDLNTARDRAKAAIEAVDKGTNPALRKKALRPALAHPGAGHAAEVADIKAEDLTRECPVLDVWKGYLKVHLVPEATESSVARFKGIFEKHVMPSWRDRAIAGIVKADALVVVDAALLRGQSAKNSTITVLSSFFNWCMDRNLIEHSPVERVKKIKMKSRKRKLSDDEIRIFWRGCDALGSAIEVVQKTKAKKPAAQFGPMFQLLLLTGSRRTEVARMERNEVNFRTRIWTIPGKRTKTKEEHQVYLCDTAIAILKALPLLKKAAKVPRVMITDKLKSYGAARKDMGLRIEHRQHKGLNNRAENSHLPTRRRERIRSPRQVQKFLSIHDQVANLFHFPRNKLSANEYRTARSMAFSTWAEIAAAPLVA